MNGPATAARAWKECRLPPLMLGTVQMGMPYGVANRTGQPDYAAARAMVKAALDGGAACFDTAAAYGASEEVLGRALRDLGAADRAVVATKVRALAPEEQGVPARAAAAIEESVAGSRRRLGIERIPFVLFHREADAVHLDALERLRARGWIAHAGVSCDNRPGPAARFAAAGVEALQIPAGVLDRRHRAAGSFTAAAAAGAAVFVRSVYLQGLLLMPEEEIPGSLRAVIPARRRIAAVADGAGLPLAELAFRYMLGEEGVACVVVGAETAAQVAENARIAGRGPLPGDVRAAVDAAAVDLPEEVVTPSLWKL